MIIFFTYFKSNLIGFYQTGMLYILNSQGKQSDITQNNQYVTFETLQIAKNVFEIFDDLSFTDAS